VDDRVDAFASLLAGSQISDINRHHFRIASHAEFAHVTIDQTQPFPKRG
jgi:hypothetical protein